MTQTARAFTATERQSYIGCSEFGAVLGLDRYKTPLDVYNAKLGLVEPFQGNNHTERGNRMEKIAADLYTEITGKKLRRDNADFSHPDYPFIVGHIDRKIVGEQKIAEIKCPSVAAYRKMQREGLPESMILQMQGYLGLSGYPSGEFLIFCADQMDLLTFAIEFDQSIYNAAIAGCVGLWQKHILPGIPPEMFGDDKAKLEFAKVGGDITFRDDEKFTEAAKLLREAAQIKADGDELYEMAKVKILGAIETEYGKYEGGGLRLSYSMQAGRTSFDKKALAATYPEIDLSRFEKQGAPFATFKPFFINE